MIDTETLQVYAERAAEYADRFSADRPDQHRQTFIDAIPPGGRVLDLGCGPGGAAAQMVAAGLQVDAWDASPEMAEIGAEQHGLTVEVRDLRHARRRRYAMMVSTPISRSSTPRRRKCPCT